MTQALYRKWRPHQWEQVIGQEHIVQTLRNAVAADRIGHAYLFAGPRGTGKTTTARLLAKAANCLCPDPAARPCDDCDHCAAVNQGRFLDLIEIDAASNTSVDDVRDLRDKINFSPNQGRYKVYIIDEVHMLSTAAFNALLKTLEEPPSHAIFILATTEIHKIPATVLSRCQRHEFRRIPVNEIVAQLKTLADGEGIQADEDALTLVARQATGSMRDAISLLDQLAAAGQRITLSGAQNLLGTAASQAVLELVDALQAANPAAGIEAIHRTLDSGADPRQFARQIVDYLRSLLLVRMNNADQLDAPSEIRAQMARHAQAWPTAGLLRILRAFNQAANDIRLTWQPALPLEMALVEALESSSGSGEAEPVEQTAREQPRQPSAPARAARPSPPPARAPETRRAGESPQEAAPAPAQPDGFTDDDTALSAKLNENWRQIVSLVKLRAGNTAGLLNSTKTRELRGTTLTLGFASDLLQSQMEKPANIEIIQEILSETLGVSIIIRCITVSGKRTAPPPEVNHDGMVASALRDLGGEIVDIQ